MARDDLVLYLTLTPEFGGTRFGPFEGLEVRLGSDRERSHIALAEGLGVVKDHCKVLRQGPDSLILTPAERTAAVWLWKAGAVRPTQVQTPTAVRPGDAFSLVTPQGPRFVIELGPLPDAIKAQRSTTGKRSRRNLSPIRLAAEVWRLFISRLYTFSPVSVGARVWYFIQSGAIWQPRILITLVLSGMAGLTMLLGSCHILSLRNQLSTMTSANTELRATAQTCEDLAGKRIESYDLTDLTYRLTGSAHLKKVLTTDGALRAKVEEHARFIAGNRDRYEWMYRNETVVSALKRWRERLMDNPQTQAGIDPVTRKLLFFAAAVPNRIDREWSTVLDSQGEGTCVRGPMALTYRQARNLGIVPQPDAFWQGDAAEYSTNPGSRLTLLNERLTRARAVLLDETMPTTLYNISQGERACVFAEGTDERTDTGQVARMLIRQVGTNADGVPGPDFDNAEVARLAKLYSSDVPGFDFTGAQKLPIQFSRGAPSAVLRDVPGGDWVVDQVADVIARSLVLPCDALLNGDPDEMKDVFGTMPDAIPCLVLFYRLQSQ